MSITIDVVHFIGFSMMGLGVLLVVVGRMGKRKKDPTLKLVPVAQSDTRYYGEKWNDENYVINVGSMASNPYFISEVSNALTRMRANADLCQDPQTLKGCQVGVSILKELLCLGEKAREVTGGRSIKDIDIESGFEFG